MSTQDVKDYFYRHFLGLVKVNSVPPAMIPPKVFSPKRGAEVRSKTFSKHSIEVHQAQTQTKMKVIGAELLACRGIRCSSRGFRFASELLNVKETQIRKYSPDAIALNSFSNLKTKTRDGTKQLLVLPQERANRLQWQTVRPKRNGEMILAWFGPIVESAVAKLTLNKRRGTLLIWYNPQSRHFDVKGLYLYRRLGINENLEWRWL